MNKAAVYHQAGYSYAYPIDMHSLKIRLKAAKSDLIELYIIYGSRYPLDNQDPKETKKMELIASDSLHDYFETVITVKDSRFRYYFYLNDGREELWYTEKGFTKVRPHGIWGFGEYFQYPKINKNDIFSQADWVQDAVFYQIFPDRFHKSSTDNSVNYEKWGKRPKSDSFFGGDLQGIIEKLDYLDDLGINAIYLTPIFKSSSNHKYNTDDYYSIDPAFGDKKTARRFVVEAHKRGIKVVLDAVFNHCGYDFFAFKDLREKGANSKYKDWFFVDSFPLKTNPPLNYDTFANNIKNMPKLNTSNPEVQSYFLDLAEYWLRELDIDGWRLDVANEVDHQFWCKFRERLRSIKKDVYIVGENWHNSEEWLQGDQFDAIMNYPLAMAIFDFFAYKNIGSREFNNRLVKNWFLYQEKVNFSMMNLLDSHDTPRIKAIFSNKKAMNLAILFQFTYPGAPMLYYGTEVGMEGGDDPDCRRCMIWDKEEQDLEFFNYYKKLITLRRNFVSLRRGALKTIIIDEVKNIFAFMRSYKDQKKLVIINNSSIAQKYYLKAEHLDYQRKIEDHLTGESCTLKNDAYMIELPEYSARILS
ncbi:glycoside hydrolase family 13 protein [Natronospora cellulosivora (SeqCode)]